MIVVLGELGGRDEYSLVEALKEGKINKPVVAWVSGTCARLFKSEVQFGHAVSYYYTVFVEVSSEIAGESLFAQYRNVSNFQYFVYAGGKEWWRDGVCTGQESGTSGCWGRCSNFI